MALRHAAELDAERAEGNVRGILHGIPIGVKDNIETRAEDGMDTTAGSFALKGAVPPGDAAVIQNLRAAGAIILCGCDPHLSWAHSGGADNSFRRQDQPRGLVGMSAHTQFTLESLH